LVPNGGRDRTHPNATVRWTVAHARLDGHATIIFAPRAKMQIDPGYYLKGKRRQKPPLFWYRMAAGIEPIQMQHAGGVLLAASWMAATQ
jgi:hypothetical protein